MINLKYTPEQEIELKEGYEAIVGEDDAAYDQRDDFILKFMAKHDKSKKSLVAKMSKMGIQRNIGRISATPRAQKASTQKKTNRLAARKTPTKMRAIGEPK